MAKTNKNRSLKQRKHFTSKEIRFSDSVKEVRHVTIRNGCGNKSVTKYRNGRKIFSRTRKLNRKEIDCIHRKQFVPGLFESCFI